MKVCVYSHARCATNLFDNSKLKDYFRKNNCEVVDSCQEADLVLVNTCAFSEKSENDSIQVIKRIEREKRKDTQMIVFGCLASINKEKLKREFSGLILTHKELDRLDEIIKAKNSFLEVRSNFLQPEMLKQTEKKKQGIWSILNFLDKTKIFSTRSLRKILRSGFDFSPSTYYIQISLGCLGVCSYCAIRYARGRIKSKPINEIVDEIRFSLSKGYRDFVLVSEDSGAYGKDIGVDFNSLLSDIARIDESIRLYVYQINPSWVIENTNFLIQQVKENNIVFLCVPIQSGNDRILKLMNRGYQIGNIKRALKALRENCPELCIASHFMVGFPGETDAEFQDTVAFIKEMKFDSAAVFRFGARPRTSAIKMPGQISESVKLERLKKVEKTIFWTRLKSLKIPVSFSN